jgi:foldase protein PrsA
VGVKKLMKIRRMIITVTIGALALSVTGCNMVTKTQTAIDSTIVAKVNKDTITKKEYQVQLDKLIKNDDAQYGTGFSTSDQGKAAIATQKPQLLDQMISEVLVLQKADELKLTPSKADLKTAVDKQIADIKKNTFSDDQTKFDAGLKSAGYTLASLTADIEKSVKIGKVMDYINKDLTVSDSEIKDYYTLNPYNYTEQPDQIDIAHLLVADEATAVKAKARITAGEAFAKVATELTTDTASKAKGGDLGYQPYVNSGLDATFMKAAMALKNGEVSNPVQTQFGWHVIKVLGRKEYKEKPLASVTDEIKTTLLSTKKNDAQTKQIDAWKAAAKITKYEKNL